MGARCSRGGQQRLSLIQEATQSLASSSLFYFTVINGKINYQQSHETK